MKIIALLLIWMAPAIFVIVKNWLERGALSRRLVHDHILYSFCDVRDRMALAVVNGKLEEDSQIFKFFYTTNAKLIHNHAEMGLCFSSLVKEIDSNYTRTDNEDRSVEMKRLRRELQHADQEVQNVAMVWVRALAEALYLNSPRFRIELHRQMAESSPEKVKVQMEEIANSRHTASVKHVAQFGAQVAGAVVA